MIPHTPTRRGATALAALRSMTWRRRAALAAGCCAAAVLGLACAAQAALLALYACSYVNSWGEPDAGGYQRREAEIHAVTLARGQAMAMAALADAPGTWSTYFDGDRVQVLAKGEARLAVAKADRFGIRAAPTPSLDVRDGVPSIYVRRIAPLCHDLLRREDLKRFVARPMEWSLTGTDGWTPYGRDLDCEALGETPIWLRLSAR